MIAVAIAVGAVVVAKGEVGVSFHQNLAQLVLVKSAFSYGRISIDYHKGIPVIIAAMSVSAKAGCTYAGESARLAKDTIVKQRTIHAV